MKSEQTLAWFLYGRIGSGHNIGIYKKGSVVDLSKVVVLDAHQSGIVADIEKNLTTKAEDDHSAVMQQVLRAFYEAAAKSGAARLANA